MVKSRYERETNRRIEVNIIGCATEMMGQMVKRFTEKEAGNPIYKKWRWHYDSNRIK